MKANPVGWFEIYVNDLARAKKFYETVFKTELTPLSGAKGVEMLAFPMDRATMGAGGTLVKMDGFKAGGNGVIIYFTSEDCSIEENRVTNAGGQIQKTKFSIGEWGYIALALDTEGNMFGIHSRK